VKYPLFSDEYFMNEALKEAHKAFEMDEVPVGAIVCIDNQVIARAHNMTEELEDVTAHAEILAITAAENNLGAKYLRDCKVYITLEPCVMCAGALKWAQPGMVIYGASDPKAGFTLVDRSILHPKTKLISGILENECRFFMQEFFERKR
jgi:tRNA(adenine34) deaminase